MKHIVILENKPVCFELFLRKLPDSVVSGYHFHLVNDDRRFPLMEELETAIQFRRPALRYTLHSGLDIVSKWEHEFNLPDWARSWAYLLKVLLPIHFRDLGRFLHLDDDTVLLKDPEELFRPAFGAPREGFGIYEGSLDAQIYSEVFGGHVELDRHLFNIGTMTISTAGAESYAVALRRFLHHHRVAALYSMNSPLLDEKFLTHWLKRSGAETFGPELVTVSNAPMNFTARMKAPIVFHYAVKDPKIPDYIDYFRLSHPVNAEGEVVSYFSNAEDFAARTKRTAVPMYKTAQRAQNPAFALEALFQGRRG